MPDDAFVAAYADTCFADGTTVVGYIEGDLVLGAAEIHERAQYQEPTAEIAFSVEKEFQHRGIGSRLFARLIAHSKALGYTRLCVNTHPQNLAMQALARRYNARLRFCDGAAIGIVELDPLAESMTEP